MTQTHLASGRLETVAQQHPKLVAEQEVDDAKAKDQNATGALAAAKQHVDEATAELNKTQSLLNYADITAPFDGVITHRYADPGALIQAGTSSSQTSPVVDLEEESRLRLVFPVPESAVAKIRVGQKVRVFVSALQKYFDITVSRFSDKVDRETRAPQNGRRISIIPTASLSPACMPMPRSWCRNKTMRFSVPMEAVSMAEQTLRRWPVGSQKGSLNRSRVTDWSGDDRSTAKFRRA